MSHASHFNSTNPNQPLCLLKKREKSHFCLKTESYGSCMRDLIFGSDTFFYTKHKGDEIFPIQKPESHGNERRLTTVNDIKTIFLLSVFHNFLTALPFELWNGDLWDTFYYILMVYFPGKSHWNNSLQLLWMKISIKR